MNLAASLFPLVCWVLYGQLVRLIESRRPSLSAIMSAQRRRWVANAVHRDTPLDAILASNLMGSISFFASTTVLLLLALFTIFSQIEFVLGSLSMIVPGEMIARADVERHLLALAVMFMLAFLVFTLSLRQFNHFCIMLGAADHNVISNDAEIDAISSLNSLGARNFNQGIRAYYFAIPALVWFLSPLASIAATIAIVLFLIQREFYSSARQMMADLKQH